MPTAEDDCINNHKSMETYALLKQRGNECFKSNDFKASLEHYTQGIINAPTYCVKESEKGEHVTEYPLAILYSNRSASCFRIKEYEQCILDVDRAFANGEHGHAREIKLLCRLAWAYWHLKQFKRCAGVVDRLLKQQNGKKYKEVDVLKALLERNVDKNDNLYLKSEPIGEEVFEKEYTFDNKQLNGASSNVQLSYEPEKGRFLKTKYGLLPGDGIISEETYCGVLNRKYIGQYCNYCFTECALHGIPCHGCSKALYCNEKCRLKAWNVYHWLECSMWPILQQVDAFAHVALRVILHGAYEFSLKNKNLKESDCEKDTEPYPFLCIAADMHKLYPPVVIKATKNKKKGKIKQQQAATPPPTVNKNGIDPESRVYNGDYWSIYCLQTHANEHLKTVLAKSTLYANYIAKVLNQCFPGRGKKQLNSSKNPPNGCSTKVAETANVIRSTFMRLSFKEMQANCGRHSFFEIEPLKKRIEGVCEQMAVNAPNPSVKQRNLFMSKELPQTFQSIISYLLRHHILQLYTNSQAIFNVIRDNMHKDEEVSTLQQQRIATALFPTTSLLNHSCSANTVITFKGRKTLIRSTRTLNVGDEISHSYGPCISRHCYEDRQEILSKQYFFTCHCDSCLKYEQGDSDERAFLQQFTAYKCKKCEGPAVIMEGSFKNEVIMGKCLNVECETIQDLTEASTRYNNIVHITQVIAQRLYKRQYNEGLGMLKRCLSGMDEILYKNHQSKSNIHDQLAYCYTHLRDYKSAAKHVKESLKTTSMRFGTMSMEAARESFKVATLYFNANMPGEAKVFLNKTIAVYKKILPDNSEEIRKAEQMLATLKAYREQFANYPKSPSFKVE
ncbi:protein-lysine N-methyltransferase SMYD4-like [Clavelina lepadiformis]|uniref:protein-lysine N-methyltransferase SMYD4-like n=1 Tax=Clavelina lepadiformis TaxID=159417 RepID=UPI00404382E3